MGRFRLLVRAEKRLRFGTGQNADVYRHDCGRYLADSDQSLMEPSFLRVTYTAQQNTVDGSWRDGYRADSRYFRSASQGIVPFRRRSMGLYRSVYCGDCRLYRSCFPDSIIPEKKYRQ